MRHWNTSLVLVLLAAPFAGADDWPQWLGTKRDGVWREKGIVKTLPEKLTYKWRTPIGGGYAGPAVANGNVYVTDRQIREGEENPENPFDRRPVGGSERILCLDERTGKVVWEHEYPSRYAVSYPAGPRATPTIHDGKVYSLGVMGDFFCLDAQTGKVIWQKNFVKEYHAEINTWGMSAAPLIDGDNVIVLIGGAPDSCVVALNKETGGEVWRALYAKDPGYCPPVIFEAGGTRQLIIWTPVELASLDPETGKVHWQQPFPLKAGLSIPTPIYDSKERTLFVTAFYNGPLMMKLDANEPKAELLWKGKSNSELPNQTDGLHSIMPTPVFDNGYIYGICSYGELRCLEQKTGNRVWQTHQATGKDRWWNAFLIKHEDRYFIPNEQGELIIAKLSPQGYDEISRAFLIEPTNRANRRKVVWSHPAFANRCIYARNDKEIVCVDLGEK